jgi:hypothetical protein
MATVHHLVVGRLTSREEECARGRLLRCRRLTRGPALVTGLGTNQQPTAWGRNGSERRRRGRWPRGLLIRAAVYLAAYLSGRVAGASCCSRLGSRHRWPLFFIGGHLRNIPAPPKAWQPVSPHLPSQSDGTVEVTSVAAHQLCVDGLLTASSAPSASTPIRRRNVWPLGTSGESSVCDLCAATRPLLLQR